ncbi:MAG: phosphatidylserine decarboxylase [Endomicrobiales bacterium]|nr:phosphatidylserine decarboxylase [Endomicrobiales bacterium]
MSLAKEGFAFILIPAVIGILFFLIGRGPVPIALGSVCVCLGLFFAFFFRDPARDVTAKENELVSPGDGKVMEIVEENGEKIIRIFLSVFDVHIQRAPFDGTLAKVEYRPGRCLPAYKPEAHILNEQNVFYIDTKKGRITVKQIAGILARRVVSWKKDGDILKKGEKIGIIKFGSQVDVHMPVTAEIRVKQGDKVAGNTSVLAELK